MSSKNVKNFWKNTEERRLATLYGQGKRLKEIARDMNRTPRSIDSKVRFMAEQGRLKRWYERTQR